MIPNALSINDIFPDHQPWAAVEYSGVPDNTFGIIHKKHQMQDTIFNKQKYIIVIQLKDNPQKFHSGWHGWVEFLLHLKLNS